VAIGTMDELVAGFIKYPYSIRKDSVTAEAAGQWHSAWYQTGVPGAGSAPTGALNGATFSGTVAGQIPIPAAVTNKISYLSKLSAIQGGNIGSIQIWDRLWGNVPVVTTATIQNITSPAWPSRDASGGTSGEQVWLALECSSATGNGSPITNTTAVYTNSTGTGSRAATLSSFPATAVAGTIQLFSHQAGDTGVRSVQSVTLGTSYVSGAIHLLAIRLVAEIPVPTANIGNALSWTQLNLPWVWDNSVLFATVLPTATSLSAWNASLGYAQG
jgi:hypothetical protein